MKKLPVEIINMILTYRERHPCSVIINGMIKNYKKEVHNSLIHLSDDGCYHYSFYNWYFNINSKKYIFIYYIF
jgi:hypothetical protein